MRVLHVTTSFPFGPDDAAGPFVLRLVEALEKRGVSCQVLTPASIAPSQWPASVKVERFRYALWRWQRLAQQPGGIPAALKRYPVLHFLLPFFLLAMARAIIRLATHCDVIQAHWSINGALAVLTQPFHKCPVVTTLHGSDHVRGQGGGLYRWLHRQAVTRSACVVGVSEAITHSLKQALPQQSEHFFFLPNGVGEEFFSIRPENRPVPSPLKLLFVGSLIPLKGVDVLLKAIHLLPKNLPIAVSLVGDGPEKEKLVQLASQLEVDSRTTFNGTVSPKDVPALMADHHVLVLPSQREGRPSVVLEAMAAAMAVVATDIDGTRELVQEGETGWLFPPRDKDSLVKLLMSIQKQEKDIHGAGLAGRQWMQNQKLTWAETAEQYQMLYEKAIKRHPFAKES